MALNKPNDASEILDKFAPDQIRNVMSYLGSDQSAREKMLNNGSITHEDAKLLDAITGDLKAQVLKTIFGILNGHSEEAA